MQTRLPEAQGLYNPENEHDNCGIGFVAHIKGKPSHDIVQRGLKFLEIWITGVQQVPIIQLVMVPDY